MEQVVISRDLVTCTIHCNNYSLVNELSEFKQKKHECLINKNYVDQITIRVIKF